MCLNSRKKLNILIKLELALCRRRFLIGIVYISSVSNILIKKFNLNPWLGVHWNVEDGLSNAHWSTDSQTDFSLANILDPAAKCLVNDNNWYLAISSLPALNSIFPRGDKLLCIQKWPRQWHNPLLPMPHLHSCVQRHECIEQDNIHNTIYPRLGGYSLN